MCFLIISQFYSSRVRLKYLHVQNKCLSIWAKQSFLSLTEKNNVFILLRGTNGLAGEAVSGAI